ncbi:Fc fragment of IgE, low affinity II, receptor for (CD23) [Chamberlinius hualienensis]
MVLVFAKKTTRNLIEEITNVTTTNAPKTTETPSITTEITIPTTTTTSTPIVPDLQSEFILIGSFCYYFSNTPLNWTDAHASCQSKQADLAHPSTEEKNTQLVNYAKAILPRRDFWWLGASDLAMEGSWTWTHDNSRLRFRNWAKEQPDNAKNDEDCLNYWTTENWGWNDMSCKELAYYICELKQNPQSRSLIG